MKKYLPFIFPAIAILIVIFLAVRWYNLNTDKKGQVNEFAQGIEVEDIDLQDIMAKNGAKDLEKVDLNDNEGKSLGSIRYQIENQKVQLSVLASLPELTAGRYQVWFKQVDSDAVKKAFVLSEAKGGFLGSAAISADVLPFEVVVSKELVDDNILEEIVLKGLMTGQGK